MHATTSILTGRALRKPRHPYLRDLVSRLGEAPLVYVMARLCDFGSPMEAAALRWLAEHFPHASIRPARDCWRDTEHWLSEWPAFAPTVQLGVVVTASHIGPGVARELCDLSRLGKLLLWLRWEKERIEPYARFRVEPHILTSPTHYGYLTAHPPVGERFMPILSIEGSIAPW